MLLALGAASTALNAVQSLTSSLSSSASSTGFDQGSANPFEVASPAPTSASSVPSTGFSAGAQISPATMSELLAAQSQSSTTTPASTSASSTLQDMFSQIDGNGDGEITKSEFENALGAGGTTAPASATSSYQSLGQLFQREAQAISFSVAPLSFNA